MQTNGNVHRLQQAAKIELINAHYVYTIELSQRFLAIIQIGKSQNTTARFQGPDGAVVSRIFFRLLLVKICRNAPP
jgi:hypothetical protein